MRALARARARATSTRRSRTWAAHSSTGVPAGYCRLFLDEGEPMVELLRVAAGSGRTWRARQRRPRCSAPPDPTGHRPTAGPAVPPGQEALSEREVEVLRLLATDLTGPEIARQLFMSVNTFRTHTRHIFTKLDVKTRRAAVRRAAELEPALASRPAPNHNAGHIVM